MDINRANLDALFTTYSTAWRQIMLDQTKVDEVMFMATQFPSMSASNFYSWLDRVPRFRKWVGDRIFRDVRSQKFTVANVDYEDSVGISLNDILDDQFGQYAAVVGMMADAWQELKREIIIDVLTDNSTTFTGKALVADDHAYGDYTIDNKTTSALTAASFNAAILAASAWQFSNGSLVKPRFTHLVVGESLRTTAWNILENTRVANTGTSTTHIDVAIDNPNRGRCKMVVLPEIAGTYASYWWLIDASHSVSPIALQIRKEAAPFMNTDPARLEETGRMDYLASGRIAAAPTFPHLVYGGIV